MNRKNIGIVIMCLIATAVFASMKINNIYSQHGDEWKGYDAEWKQVEQFENDGLPKSALEETQKIFDYAKKENNTPQIIKATIYKSKYTALTEEDGNIKAITIIESEMQNSSGTEKNILQSILAELYWNYYTQNRWQFQNRTQTVNFDNSDITTWDIQTLHDKTLNLYTASVNSIDALKKEPLRTYDALVISGDKTGRLLRPSLFDFLAHRALDFLMNDEAYITKPAYAFEINDTQIFGDDKTFLKTQYTSSDSISKKLLAIDLLQKLTEIHMADPYPAALVDIDIKRLQFAKNNSVLPQKDSLFLNALLSLETKYIKDSSSAQVSYLIAQWHRDLGSTYHAPAEDNKWELKKAIEICDAAIKRFPTAIGSQNCLSLKQTIESKSIQITAEQINIPDAPFRALVTWKNLSQIHLKLIKLSDTDRENMLGLNNDERITHYNTLPAVKIWIQPLPNDGDRQQHAAEIKIDALPLGCYALMASDDSSFSTAQNGLAFQEIWISNISYVSQSMQNGGKEFYVMDRTTGKPIKEATIQLYSKEYNYNTRKYIFKKSKSYTTSDAGKFSVDAESNGYYFSFSIASGKDYLDIENNYSVYKPYRDDERKSMSTYFFTDRSIYRPGQTIYFKGILVESSADGKTKKVVTNKSTQVTYYDVNSQKIATLSLKSNDYGSFSGSFTAPQGVLTGEMQIQNEWGSTYISVEEYKRPTFSVMFEPVKGSYVLGDTITVYGVGSSYAGAAIDHAKVQYRVVRNTSFPWWGYGDYFWRRPYPNIPQTQMISGETLTDADGKFIVRFEALPDRSIDKKLNPEFSYTIYADVTDVAGETRSAQSYASVGYISLNASVNLPENIFTDSIQTVPIYTTNLNGEPQAANVKIDIYPLQAPDKLMRTRNWSEPDIFIMTKEQYYKYFPHDIYAHENEQQSWPVLGSIYSKTLDTKTDSAIQINSATWKEGKYKFILTTHDKSGQEVKIERYFTVINRASEKIIPTQYIVSASQQAIAQPGETVEVKIGSSAKDVMAFAEVTRGNETVSKQWVCFSNGYASIKVPITENDRGGLGVQFWFIKDGRFYSDQTAIQVPWTNKDLKVELETHRDKLLPGEKETWKIKISGAAGEKVAAEMVATLYDASLDDFKGHYWSFISWPYNYSGNAWTGYESFTTAEGFVWQRDWNTIASGYSTSYDYLNWFGMNMYYGEGRGGDVLYDKAVMSINADEAVAEGKIDNAKKEKLDSIEEQGAVAGNVPATNQAGPQNLDQVSVRTNLNETAFFYPQLETDSAGNIILSFTMPEALTKWNFMALAHTKNLQYQQIWSSVVTQKQLMIQPNMPRFLRAGDDIEVTAKISNLTEEKLNGTAQLELFNALNMQPVDVQFANTQKQVTFSADGKQSTSVSWKIAVPEGYDALVYRVKATAGSYSDGEENALPVLTNKILVTETMPMSVRAQQSKIFDFTRLENSKNASTIRNQSLTLEYTSNPAWYAVQALPYVMEYPYECAEQLFNRYYSNSIASYIANSSPEIKKVFDSWKNNATSLTSNLEKNQELKSLLLQETPWVLQAQDETERKKRVAILFDLNTMSNAMQAALNKLQNMQSGNGGFVWFKGGEDDRYITQYIVAGMAHLQKLQVVDVNKNDKLNDMLRHALTYCDRRMQDDYDYLTKEKIDKQTYVPSDLIIQYLYARSYFNSGQYKMDDTYTEAKTYFETQLKKYWTKYNLYEKGMIALIENRLHETTTAQQIVKSLKEYSITTEELGMYWKDNTAGYYWYNAPIETQALMIETFDEVAHDTKAVDDMKVWLLKNKQTNDWKTTKATAEACYALLLNGTDLLKNKDIVEITVAGNKINPAATEAGTGYFKTNWLGNTITPTMGHVTVNNTNAVVSWGAMYWQYFEDINNIKATTTSPLSITKKLFVQQNTPKGIVITPLNDNTPLHIGDIITVRIELRSDRDMEYIHMKDMRASLFEPTNTLSAYKWQDGLGYYQSTLDASTNFFFSYLPKGTYVFEYTLRVAHKGNCSNGISNIECMYAPEFTSHSEGIIVHVE